MEVPSEYLFMVLSALVIIFALSVFIWMQFAFKKGEPKHHYR